jgi:hypothetical protein
MFIYINDTNKQTWAINVNKVTKVVESNKSTLIYFDNGDIIKVDTPILELVPRLNNQS